MTNIVSELQAKALDSNTSVSELLRMAKFVAVKLGLQEFRQWADHELNGYGEQQVPSYRTIRGEMKVFNPFRGMIPVIFHNNDLAETCTTRNVAQKVSELESLAQKADRTLLIPIRDEQQLLLQNYFQEDMEFRLVFSAVVLTGVLDSVRNVILDWSLKLEQSGIFGEGMTFSKEDKEKAHAPGVIYQIDRIDNFTGNMGSVSDHSTVNANAQIETDLPALSSLIDQLIKSKLDFSLPQTRSVELSMALDELHQAVQKTKPNVSLVGTLLTSIRSIIQSAGSSLLVQGALFEIDKFHHLF